MTLRLFELSSTSVFGMSDGEQPAAVERMPTRALKTRVRIMAMSSTWARSGAFLHALTPIRRTSANDWRAAAERQIGKRIAASARGISAAWPSRNGGGEPDGASG